MLSNQCFKLVNVKFLLTKKKCNYDKIVPKKSVGLKACKLSQLLHFLVHCPFKVGYGTSVDLEMARNGCPRPLTRSVR